jgi:formate-dependent nitrite reductase membrane component NrfD
MFTWYHVLLRFFKTFSQRIFSIFLFSIYLLPPQLYTFSPTQMSFQPNIRLLIQTMTRYHEYSCKMFRIFSTFYTGVEIAVVFMKTPVDNFLLLREA